VFNKRRIVEMIKEELECVTEETYISISYAFEEVFGEITVFVKW
jgi:hypothetical protein